MHDEPKLPIRPTKDEPRCNDLQDVSWPIPVPIRLPDGADALISMFLPRLELRCASCGRVVWS